MPKSCAYCDRTQRLTKEHVWPSCFLQRFGVDAAKFSVRAEKVHGSDYVVRDVCEECNSSYLTSLDAYFCDLYDSQLSQLRDCEATVDFEYDYDLLARSLLKIAYNTARTGVSDPAALAKLRSYILGKAARPDQLAIFIELLSPSILEDRSGPIVTTKKVLPRMFRSALTQFLGPGGDSVLTRIVGVNSFFFHLVVPRQTMLTLQFEEVASIFGSSIQGLVRIEPLLKAVRVRSSPQDGLQSFLPQLEAFNDQYKEYFARRKKDSP